MWDESEFRYSIFQSRIRVEYDATQWELGGFLFGLCWEDRSSLGEHWYRLAGLGMKKYPCVQVGDEFSGDSADSGTRCVPIFRIVP